MFQILVELQRTIYLAVGEQIKLLSAGGDWLAFMGFLPMGVVFGAAHALTPGHSKAVLATYLAGSDAKVSRGLLVSIILSFTHVTIAVLLRFSRCRWFPSPWAASVALRFLRISVVRCSA